MKNFKALMEFKTEHSDVFDLVQNQTKWADDKVWLWFNSANPLLGNFKPIYLIQLNRKEKLLTFIDNCINGHFA